MNTPAQKAPQITDIARHVWERKYRAPGETSVQDSWQRVARAIAAAEPDAAKWQERFLSLLRSGTFIPAGRIIAGAGRGQRTTLSNCFVMDAVPDDMAGIFDSLRESALTMQAGGGIGCDFSLLRPQGFPARASGNIASGPVSFLHVWSAMCGTLLASGARRGAMLASLRCDHPDIGPFIDAKRQPGVLANFNLSVQVSDAFMTALRAGEDWPLVFPLPAGEEAGGREILERVWTGSPHPVTCVVAARVPATELWQRLMRANYDSGEPGVLFVDHINDRNNLAWREQLGCTNPCGEVPLPAYGSCNLGSLDLSRFVEQPFSPKARLEPEALAKAAMLAVRFLDDVIDRNWFPLPQQDAEARATRRIGLGITGLGDALLMLGLHYGADAGRKRAAEFMRTISHAAYRASILLAREKGPFPAFDKQACLSRPFIRELPPDLIKGIGEHGLRNSHLLAIAPAGTISLLAGNVSSGIEPVYAFAQRRKLLDADGKTQEIVLVNKAWMQWREVAGKLAAAPWYFATAATLNPREHLLMQAALQPCVDNAISKTINVPEDCSFEEFSGLYEQAWELGLKGCTTFRAGSREAVLSASTTDSAKHSKDACADDIDAAC